MAYLLAALSLFALLPFGQRAPAETIVYESGRWRLEVHRNAFRREVRCRITDDYGHFPKVIAESQALLLRLPRSADGSTAWFSVDGALAKPWRDVEASLIATGAMVDAESLDNLTGGRLPLPYSTILHANSIAVQIKDGERPQIYSLQGIWPIAAAGNRLGCRFGGA